MQMFASKRRSVVIYTRLKNLNEYIDSEIVLRFYFSATVWCQNDTGRSLIKSVITETTDKLLAYYRTDTGISEVAAPSPDAKKIA